MVLELVFENNRIWVCLNFILFLFFPAPLECGIAIVTWVCACRGWLGVRSLLYLLPVVSNHHHVACPGMAFANMVLRSPASVSQALLVNRRGGCPGCRRKGNLLKDIDFSIVLAFQNYKIHFFVKKYRLFVKKCWLVVKKCWLLVNQYRLFVNKNIDFLSKNVDFLSNNIDILSTNVDFLSTMLIFCQTKYCCVKKLSNNPHSYPQMWGFMYILYI